MVFMRTGVGKDRGLHRVLRELVDGRDRRLEVSDWKGEFFQAT